MKNILPLKNFLKSVLVMSALILTSSSKQNLNAAPGDTTWVTTFNQNFQNWADVHYQNFTLPDTNTHYREILMFYTIGCPAAGCDPWDRLGWLRIYIDSNINYEIARVITPYNIVGGGLPGQCVFKIDVTDYMSLLRGDVRLGSYIESWIGGTRGWLVTVKFAYIEGETKDIPYKVVNLWQNNHIIYGDPANPAESFLTPQTVLVDAQVTKAKVRLTNTGHGQGNTGNAAEFLHAYHQVIVNGTITEHDLWRYDCTSNPCSPQGGTWGFNRAGWCPGSGVIPFEVDATTMVIPGQNAVIDYNLQAYENFCRPNPNCISGQTCADCNYNNNGHTEPHYTVQGQLILYKHNPFVNVHSISSGIPSEYLLEQNYPNPFNPSTKIQFHLPKSSDVKLDVYDIRGKFLERVAEGQLPAGSYSVDWNAKSYPSGIYIYKIETGEFAGSKRMILLK